MMMPLKLNGYFMKLEWPSHIYEAPIHTQLELQHMEWPNEVRNEGN